MKKFHFRLDAIERARKIKEEEALRLLARAQRILQENNEKKKLLLEELHRALTRREELGRHPITVLSFQLENEFISGMKQKLIQLGHAIQRSVKSVEKSLGAYLAARKKTRAIEILHEKAFAYYKKEVRRKEAKELSDLYLMRSRVD